MERTRIRQARRLLWIGALVLATGAAMSHARLRALGGNGAAARAGEGRVTLLGRLTQEKVLHGGDGTVGLSLTLHADPGQELETERTRGVDMVIVLDRSGSMEGEKIAYARQAVQELLAALTPGDRFALITYSDEVRQESTLGAATPDYRARMQAVVRAVQAGGSTNLGGGLQQGVDLLLSQSSPGRLGRVVLISDGLANQGVTDPAELCRTASLAAAREFAVSTVGVGADFNEQLLTALADHGTGNYTYLEDPAAFAAVFQQEFFSTRAVAASALEIHVPLADGISLVDAAGFPVEIGAGEAVFYPGNLLSGQTRKLFLSLRVPTDREARFSIPGISARYLSDGRPVAVRLATPFHIACVRQAQEVFASIDAGEWEQKVLHEDYNKLREEVALDIKKGDRDGALRRIDGYRDRQQAVNAQVKSEAVAGQLDQELGSLRGTVGEVFSGSADEVRQKQKTRAKSMQYDGYAGRRAKK